MRMHLPFGLKSIAKELIAHNYQSYLVGGAMRDMLLGRKVKDYDIATDALPEEVIRLFRRVIPTGIKHGTVTVLSGSHRFEVTTFRTEGKYSDHRKPDFVNWVDSIDEDLKRRDFTINALAYDMKTKSLYDPFSGTQDLKKKIIRAIGHPDDRFTEDALRILRAARFAAQLEFSIETETFDAMKRQGALIDAVSSERIRDELIKILESDVPSRGFFILHQTGLLRRILPELDAGSGVRQPSLHCFDVFVHSLYSCDGASSRNLEVRLAALFHDIGKPVTQALSKTGEICFYNHEKEGTRLVQNILQRLHFPTRITEKVSLLIRSHMFNYDRSWKDGAVRRFIQRVGPDNLTDLFALRRADQYGMCQRPLDSNLLHEFEKRIESVLASPSIFSLKNLAINGDDIKTELKIEEGRTVGLILDFLLESVLDDPSMNDRNELLKLARRFHDERLEVQ